MKRLHALLGILAVSLTLGLGADAPPKTEVTKVVDTYTAPR